ncbi:hypothetical protein Ae201684P_017018 [Aphanomyces euteiches]|nr:hypothetical protein Ae201684P_017018 [Aphanomyces euteiches]KAH9140254.1 hypothetical protein AeRB84_015485 [Aphanomyces euteiches]
MSTWMTWTYAAAILASATANGVAFTLVFYTEHAKAPQSSAHLYSLLAYFVSLGANLHACFAWFYLCSDGDVASGLKCQIWTNAAFAIALVLVAVSMSTIDTTDESSTTLRTFEIGNGHFLLGLRVAIDNRIDRALTCS